MTKKITKTQTLRVRVSPATYAALELEARKSEKFFGFPVTVSDVVRKHLERALQQKQTARTKVEILKRKASK